eukprot:Plantae.Rhodophyta-Hildenbrandia_rubra.ctg5570.p1 GENE.Plantae.Rhodophyta-Hildenbrandia_rubra.ctg5570~~Plantae.Rhodophyta-Hildenbrandia_rubra.ctg5570.p1  ORF type:complete len:320 (-),score=46.08 Plantae.Rhodophyta-Hildenbrandia_rubra.ctg5570:283-1242(-)
MEQEDHTIEAAVTSPTLSVTNTPSHVVSTTKGGKENDRTADPQAAAVTNEVDMKVKENGKSDKDGEQEEEGEEEVIRYQLVMGKGLLEEARMFEELDSPRIRYIMDDSDEFETRNAARSGGRGFNRNSWETMYRRERELRNPGPPRTRIEARIKWARKRAERDKVLVREHVHGITRRAQSNPVARTNRHRTKERIRVARIPKVSRVAPIRKKVRPPPRKRPFKPLPKQPSKQPAKRKGTENSSGSVATKKKRPKSGPRYAKDGKLILPHCVGCGMSSTSTPMMRKGPDGQRSLCNACGLKWSRHGIIGDKHVSKDGKQS